MNRLRVAVAAIACVAIFSIQANAQNDVLTRWTFEAIEMTPPVPPATISTLTTAGPHQAEEGSYLGQASAVGGNVYSHPVGNGTAESFSFNGWNVGDYFQFQTSTIGVMDLGLQFDQFSSSTGPRDFKVEYSLNGTTFTDVAGGSYMVEPTTSGSFTSGSYSPLFTRTFDLTGITALNNAANVYFRLTNTSTVSLGGNGGTVAATGTNRVDTVTIFNNFELEPPTPPELPVAGDIVFGMSTASPGTTLELVRGPATSNGGAKIGSTSAWTTANFIQQVKFDNYGGNPHNVRGNLLGVNVGSVSMDVISSGTIRSFATQGDIPLPAGELIGDTAGTGGGGVTLSRLGGLSVSPNNSRVAVSAWDTGKVVVYNYSPGNTMGSGASMSAARESADTPLATGGSQGTAWLNDSTVLAFSTSGQLYEVNEATMASTLVQTVTVPDHTSENTALAYNPAVSPYIYALYGGFSNPFSQSELYVINPAAGYSVINTVDLSLSETVRDLAIDANGNLFISRREGLISVIPNAAANAGTITSGSVLEWYASDTTSGFNGLDVGFEPGPGLAGDYNEDGSVDAADYTVWRNNLGGAADAFPNRDPGNAANPINGNDYTFWKNNYAPAGSGGGGLAAVPEPASLALVLLGMAGLWCGRRR